MSYPELFTTPLQPFAAEVPGHDELLREFSDPKLRDLYVERELFWQYTDESADGLPLHEKRSRFVNGFLRLQASGVQIPHFYIVGGREYGERGMRVMAEKITPVPFEKVGFGVVRNQARRTIEGLTRYIDTTDPGQDILSDVAGVRQYIFGTSRTSRDPQFYMVDMGGFVEPLNEGSRDDIVKDVVSFARAASRNLFDPSLLEGVIDHYYGTPAEPTVYRAS